MTLTELQKEEIELKSKLSENKKQQNNLIRTEFIEKWGGANIGDTVEFLDGKEVVQGVISKIDVGYFCYYFVFLFKNNGTTGKRERCIYRPETMIIKKKADKQ